MSRPLYIWLRGRNIGKTAQISADAGRDLREAERRSAADAGDLLQYVGKTVRWKRPGPNGSITSMGVVKAPIRPGGSPEVKEQQGGYYKLDQIGSFEVIG